MQLTTQQQTAAFLWAFLLGLGISVLYTAISIIRTLSTPSKIQLFISDTLFMIIVSLLNVIFSISQTEGKIRFYVIAAELISFIIWYISVHRPLIGLIKCLYNHLYSKCELLKRKLIVLFINKTREIVFVLKKSFKQKKI